MITNEKVQDIRELSLEEIAEVSGGGTNVFGSLSSIERSICSFVSQIWSCFSRSMSSG